MTGPALDELLGRLVASQVRFVLVGGLAVNAWRVVRGTTDVDIVAGSKPAAPVGNRGRSRQCGPS